MFTNKNIEFIRGSLMVLPHALLNFESKNSCEALKTKQLNEQTGLPV